MVVLVEILYMVLAKKMDIKLGNKVRSPFCKRFFCGCIYKNQEFGTCGSWNVGVMFLMILFRYFF